MKNIIKRLATKEEIETIYLYIIERMWNDNVKYSETIGKDEVEKGFKRFKDENLNDLKNQIQDFIIVSELDLNCFLFSFSYLFIDKEKVFYETSSSILKVNDQFKEVDDYDLIDLNLEKNVYKKSFSNKKPGRPSEPLEENILKSNRIYFNLKNNHTLNVDEECKKENISKSTYYRVIKWLRENTAIKFN